MSVSDPLEDALAQDHSWVVCLRPLNAVGHESMRGEILSTEDWPQHRISTLIERRYIAPYPKGLDLPEPTKVEGVVRRLVNVADVEEATKRQSEAKAKPTPQKPKASPKAKAAPAKKAAPKTTKKK
jgi:hypothetical protein